MQHDAMKLLIAGGLCMVILMVAGPLIATRIQRWLERRRHDRVNRAWNIQQRNDCRRSGAGCIWHQPDID